MTMNQPKTPSQLHKDPIKRHAIIKSLMQQNDEASLKQLEYYAEHDPVPILRQMAGKAVQQFRHHQPINSLYVDDAISYLLKAEKLHEQGSDADALYFIARALECDPRLQFDMDLQQLTIEITGYADTVSYIADLDSRNETFRQVSYLESTKRPIFIPGVLITLIFVFIYLAGYVFANYDDVSVVIDTWQENNYRTEIKYLYEGLAYHLFIPDSEPPSEGWSVLVILNEEGAEPDSLMSLFVQMARENNVMMIVPDFKDYVYPYEQEILPELNQIIITVEESYPVNASNLVLFGYEVGGEIASLYAREFPNMPAAVITSGAPYIYAPPNEDIIYKIIYGYDDPLLPHHNDNEVIFTDVTEWDFPMNYTVIEGIGRIVNEQQVDLVAEIIQQVALQ